MVEVVDKEAIKTHTIQYIAATGSAVREAGTSKLGMRRGSHRLASPAQYRR